jgi:hypothetical protein
MNSSADPRDILRAAPMSVLQIVIIGITIALNALDGFDVTSISYASPGISKEWALPAGGLGLVLSMELIGMAIGSIVIGNIADRIGRRPTMLICLALMTVGMTLATTAGNPTTLSIWRVLTGLGIGGMLAAINAVAAEFANDKRKHLSVSLMSIGYPLGAVFGGMGVARLLQAQPDNWRSVFLLGAGRDPRADPDRVVHDSRIRALAGPQAARRRARQDQPAMARMGHQSIAALPEISPAARKQSAGDIFGPAMARDHRAGHARLLLPHRDLLLHHQVGAEDRRRHGLRPVVGRARADVDERGRATGGAIFGFLTLKYGVKPLTIFTLVVSTIGVSMFGKAPADLQTLIYICMFCGFFINAGIVGLYAIIAQAFPDARPRVGHRLRHRRWPRRLGAGADHRRLPLSVRILAAHRVLRARRRLDSGRHRSADVETRRARGPQARDPRAGTHLT